MNRTMFRKAVLLLLPLLLPSCAYLQTHKNIKEIGAVYDGFELDNTTTLYRQGNQWYMAVSKCKMTKEYPALHDNVMFTEQNQDPRFEELTGEEGNKQTVYVPVSSATAQVLQHNNGYFTKSVLLQELKDNISLARTTLPGKSAHSICAAVEGKQTSFTIDSSRSPQKPGAALTAVSWVDRVVIDWPGTLVYNVCIPFMAPFAFFSDFLSDD